MWIKICGIRDVETADQVAALSPQAIGLNFYTRSPRCVTPQVATEIVTNLPDHVEPVGLFVNHRCEEILDICHRCGIQTVQIHGDEPPAFLVELQQADAQLKIIRAFRVDQSSLNTVAEYLDQCGSLGMQPIACLIDARVEGLYGGTGQTAPWDILRVDDRRQERPPVILAGGLIPKNVAEAIQTVHPWGVDVAGGVESEPGIKDLARVEAFLNNARQAFEYVDDNGAGET